MIYLYNISIPFLQRSLRTGFPGTIANEKEIFEPAGNFRVRKYSLPCSVTMTNVMNNQKLLR